MVIKGSHNRGIPQNDKPILEPVKTDINYSKIDFKHDELINEAFSGLKQKFNWTPKSTSVVANFLKQSFNKAFKKESPPPPLCQLCKHSVCKDSLISDLEVTHRFQNSYVEFVNSKSSMCSCERRRIPKGCCHHLDEKPKKYVYRTDSPDDMWSRQFKRWWGWNYGRKRDKVKKKKEHYWVPAETDDPYGIFLENRSHNCPRYCPHHKYNEIEIKQPSTLFHKLCLCCGYYNRDYEEDYNLEPVYHLPHHHGCATCDPCVPCPPCAPSAPCAPCASFAPYRNKYGYYFPPTSRHDNYKANKHMAQSWMKPSSSTITNCSICSNAGIPHRLPYSDSEYLSNRIYNIGSEGDPGDECCCCCPCMIKTCNTCAQTCPDICTPSKSHGVQTEPQIYKRRCCKCCRAGCKMCVNNCQRGRCEPQIDQRFSKNPKKGKSGAPIPKTKIYKCCSTQHEPQSPSACCSNILFSHIKTSPLFLDPIFTNPLAGFKFKTSKKHFIQPPPVQDKISKNFQKQESSSEEIDNLLSVQNSNQNNDIESLLCNCSPDDLPHIDTLLKCKNLTDKKPESKATHLLKASVELKNAVNNYKPNTNFHTYNFLATQKFMSKPIVLSNLVGQITKCDSLLQNASISSDSEQKCIEKNRTQVQRVTESETTVGETSSEVTENERKPVVQEIPLAKGKKKHSRTYLKFKKIIGFNQKNKDARLPDKKPKINDLLKSSPVVQTGSYKPALKFLEKYKAFSDKNPEIQESDLIISSRVVKNVLDNYKKLSTDINLGINESNLFKSSKVVKSVMDNYTLTTNFLEQCKKLSDVNLEINESNLLRSSRVTKNVLENYTNPTAADTNPDINNNLFSGLVKNMSDNYNQMSDILTRTSNNLRTVQELSMPGDEIIETKYLVEE